VGRRTIVLIVAVILGGLAAWGIFAFLTNVEDDARVGLDEVAVFRAGEFIDRGEEGDLVFDLFVEGTEIEELLPDNAITTLAQLQDVVLGRVSRGPISKGQVVTTDLWADAEEEVASLSELIEPGMQAIVVRPDEVRAVGGFVRAGDNVNILASTDLSRQATIDLLKNPIGRELLGLTDLFDDFIDLLPPDFVDEQIEAAFDELAQAIPATVSISFTAMQDVEVLAIGSVARGGPSAEDVAGEDETPIEGVEAVGTQLVTLEVSPVDAEKVVFIFDFLRPWLTLTSSQEPYEPVTTSGIVIGDIVGDILDRRTQELLGVELEEPAS
jgi:Flp pilus assembly protein CpaB